MNIRKLVLPTMIAALMAAPAAFAQSADVDATAQAQTLGAHAAHEAQASAQSAELEAQVAKTSAEAAELQAAKAEKNAADAQDSADAALEQAVEPEEEDQRS